MSFMKDDQTHERLQDNNLSIQDNGGISIGTIIRYFALDMVDSTIPDDIPLLKSMFCTK